MEILYEFNVYRENFKFEEGNVEKELKNLDLKQENCKDVEFAV
jgi:hypothetical protein